jgi:hypothetical protein
MSPTPRNWPESLKPGTLVHTDMLDDEFTLVNTSFPIAVHKIMDGGKNRKLDDPGHFLR